jgi:phosphotransferase system HPr-like phosphotransfer protein
MQSEINEYSTIYHIQRDIVARTAANLNFELNKYKTTIYLTKENEDFIINAKSLIGLLQGHFRENDIVKLMLFDTNYKEVGEIKELFNTIGRECNGC